MSNCLGAGSKSFKNEIKGIVVHTMKAQGAVSKKSQPNQKMKMKEGEVCTENAGAEK